MTWRNAVRAWDAAADWALRQAEAPEMDPVTKWAVRVLIALAATVVVAQVWMYLARR